MSAKMVLDGTSTGAVKAVEALNKALDATGKEAEGAVAPTKKLQEAAARLAAQADPQEKYNQKMKALVDAVKGGGLAIEKAETLAARYGKQLDSVGDKGKSAFSGVASNLASMAAGMVSATAVVGAITQAFQKAEASAQNAADAIFDSLGAVGELGQLGPKGLNQALNIQRDLIQSGTVKPSNRAQAAEIAANMVNAGLNDDQVNLLVKDLGGAGGLVKAENMDSVGGNLKSLMTQFGEKDMRAVTAQVLVAANKTKADLAVTSNNVLKFGELAAASGIDLRESMAGYVASEKSAASPEAAAEMQKSFYSQVYRRQLSTGDLEGTLNKIQAAIPKGGTAFDVLGDANAVIGFEALMKDRAGLRADLSDIAAPPPGMIRDSAQLLANVSPANRAAQLKARALGQLAVAEDDASSERELLFDAYRAELDTRGKARGEWAMTTYARNADLAAADKANIEADAFRAEITQTGLTGQRVSDDLLKAMKDYLGRIADDTEDTKKEIQELKTQQRSHFTTRPNER